MENETEVLREVTLVNTEDPSQTRTLSLFEDKIVMSGKDGDTCIATTTMYEDPWGWGERINRVFDGMVRIMLHESPFEVMEDHSFSIKAYEDAEK